MSRFKISKRAAKIKHVNIRIQNGEDGDQPAADISLQFVGTKRDLDMLVPIQEGKFSAMAYSEEGHLLVPHLSPLKVYRKPEEVEATIYDQVTKKTATMDFTGAKIKDIMVKLNNKYQLEVTLKLQVKLDPEVHAARLIHLIGAEREVEMESKQLEIFDASEEEESEDDEDEEQDSLDIDNSDPDEGEDD